MFPWKRPESASPLKYEELGIRNEVAVDVGVEKKFEREWSGVFQIKRRHGAFRGREFS